jgi:hypothetical protein
MATLQDLGVSAFINILSAFVFLLLFAVLRIQPVNDRVYFPKLYLAHKRQHDHTARSAVRRFVNLNICTYITFLSWVPGALRMSETELIAHAGLDSAVYLRIYTLGYYPIRRRNSLFLFARPLCCFFLLLLLLLWRFFFLAKSIITPSAIAILVGLTLTARSLSWDSALVKVHSSCKFFFHLVYLPICVRVCYLLLSFHFQVLECH